MSHIRTVPDAWNEFKSLLDTPNSYSGLSGHFVRVNGTPDGLEFTDDVVEKSGSTMTGALTLSGDPTSALHAATKQYVDATAQGLDFKTSVKAASTTNLTLSGEQTVDGVALVAGDRVLAKDQTTASENGIYVVASGSWTRAPDADSNNDVTSGLFCFSEEGTANGNTGWVLATEDPITLNTTPLDFIQFSGAGSYSAGDGLDLTGSEFFVTFEDSAGNIEDIGTQTAGVSNLVARADHVHAHGAQAGGNLHAVATTGAAGFMSATDKSKLDGIDAGAEVNQSAYSSFTDGTITVEADVASDVFKFRDLNYITMTLTSNDATHGDNLAIGIDYPALLEAIQDNLGNTFILDTDSIAWTYDDVGNTLEAEVSVDDTTIEINTTGSYIQVKSGVFAPISHSHSSTDISDFAEAAQDAVGAALSDSNSVNFTYDDNGNSISADILVDSMLEITGAGLRVVDNTYAPFAHVGAGGVSEHPNATAVTSGFMSTSDKSKLDGIDSGADVNQDAFNTILVDATTSIVADSPTDTLNLNAQNVISISANDTTDTINLGLTSGTNGQVITTVGGSPQWADLPSAAVTFLELTDTPGSFGGAGYRLVINGTNDALVFEADTFLNLTDSPSTFVSQGGKLVRVNSGESALEFVTSGVTPASANNNTTLYWNGTAWAASSNLYNEHSSNRVGVNTQSPNSTFHVNGSVASKVVTVSASKDLSIDSEGTAETILSNNSGSITITLPTAASVNGRRYHIKKISADGNDVVIEGASSETIDGSLNFSLTNQYESITVVCDGSAWFIV